MSDVTRKISKELRLKIAHVLFIDIAGYSKLLIDEQSETLQELNQIVRKTDAARAAVIARMMGNQAKARAAFTAARAEQQKRVDSQPNYGPALCVLALMDAALGEKKKHYARDSAQSSCSPWRKIPSTAHT